MSRFQQWGAFKTRKIQCNRMTGQALCIHLLQSDAGHALGVYFPMAGHDLSWKCKGAPQRQPQQQGCDEPLSVVVYGLWCSISCSCSWGVSWISSIFYLAFVELFWPLGFLSRRFLVIRTRVLDRSNQGMMVPCSGAGAGWIALQEGYSAISSSDCWPSVCSATLWVFHGGVV